MAGDAEVVRVEVCSTLGGGDNVPLVRASKIALGHASPCDVAGLEDTTLSFLGGVGFETRNRCCRSGLVAHDLSRHSFLLRGEWTKRGTGLGDKSLEDDKPGEEAE